MQGTLDNIREGKPPAAPRPQPMPPAVARKLDSHPQEQLGTGTNGPVALPARSAPNAWTARLVESANALTDAYAECLKHASEAHGNLVTPDAVRALVTTTYIAMTRGSSNAA
jgi:hypothetical protein